MQAILFALISYLGWGTGDIFGTIATRKIGGYSTAFWYLVFQLVLYGSFSIFFLGDLKNFTLSILALNLLIGAIGTIGMITFYESLRLSNMSLVGTISASFAALTVVLSIIFLKENISSLQGISILIIFLGIIISSLNFNDLRKAKLFMDRGVLLAIATMIMWGIYWTFIKIPVRQIGWFWPSIISIATFPLILIFMKFRNLPLVQPNSKRLFGILIANSALLGAGSLSFNYAIQKGMVAIVAPIAGSYPTLFVVLAFLVFKDKITRQQIAGIVVTLTGIVLLSFFST
jgi:drug/metabolite transporter (DMT)-like permease